MDYRPNSGAVTGKPHPDLKRDILAILITMEVDASRFAHTYLGGQGRQQMEIDSAEFSAQYIDSTGRALPCFKLNRYYIELLITGYDVRRRAAVIDRWMELEEKVAQPQVLQSFADALRLAADNQEKPSP